MSVALFASAVNIYRSCYGFFMGCVYVKCLVCCLCMCKCRCVGVCVSMCILGNVRACVGIRVHVFNCMNVYLYAHEMDCVYVYVRVCGVRTRVCVRE